MGAIFAALMGHLKPGSRVVADPCVYGCTHTLLDKLAKWGVEVTRCDTSDPDALAAAIGKKVDVVFIETPMNPTLRLVDLRQAAQMAHKAGGLLMVDNTFCTPVGQKPLALGADLVIHSLTKGINGHSDLLAGAVIGSERLVRGAWDWRKDAGAVLDPDTAWHVLRGAQTLEVRVARANGNALAVAKALSAEGIAVSHPLLPSHPDHRIAKAQMPAGCCVLTLDLDSAKAAHAFLDRLKLVARAVSLGGYESLASHPWSTTHSALPEPARRAAGITPGLVRVSCGIEPLEALMADILGALQRRPAMRMAPPKPGKAKLVTRTA
jgi:cystathionine beta-lyase/cystathionine gamma-synthase